MRLVSFNILSDDYVDFQDQKFLRRYYNNMPPERLQWSHRKARVIAKMRELKADIFLLQEVMVEARTSFQRHFSDYYIGPLAQHEFQLDGINFNRTGNLILVRKSLCRQPPTFWSVPIGLGYCVAVAQLTWRKPHGPCRQAAIFSVHLIDTPQKVQQVGRLLALVDQFPACDEIVGGDFNTKARRIHARLEHRFYSSVRVDQADRHYGTYLCERPMIDYIYTSLPAYHSHIDNGPVNSDRQTCFVRTLDEVGSDHYPVIAEV